MDVDEPAAAGAAVTEQGTGCAHLLHQRWHQNVYQTALALPILRDFPVRLPAADGHVQRTADLHKLARLTSAIFEYSR